MPAKKKEGPEAREPRAVKRKAPIAAESTVTAPVEPEAQPNADQPELTIQPSPEDIKAVAVQLALLNGERRPFAMHIGRPMWKRWETFAQAGLVAAAYLRLKDTTNAE